MALNGLSRLACERHLGRQFQAAGAPRKASIVEGHQAIAAAAAGPMQRIGKVEPTQVQDEHILDRLPAFHGDMRHALQMLEWDHLSSRMRLSVDGDIRAAGSNSSRRLALLPALLGAILIRP